MWHAQVLLRSARIVGQAGAMTTRLGQRDAGQRVQRRRGAAGAGHGRATHAGLLRKTKRTTGTIWRRAPDQALFAKHEVDQKVGAKYDN